jgi:hypothetical protein
LTILLDSWLASDAVVIVKTTTWLLPHHSPNNSRLVISSPNTNYIPKIYFGDRDLQPRADGRFGLEDPTLHPQMFSPNMPFHSVILRKPADDNERRYMWKKVRLADFVPVPGSVIEGVGLLRQDVIDFLKRTRDRMENVVEEFLSQKPNGSTNHELKILASQLRMAYQRIAFVPAQYREMVLAVSLFQRLWLEIEAWLQWTRHYYPRTIDSNPPAFGDERLIGAWSYNLHEVQELYNAGIPVWWVRREDTVTDQTNIIMESWISNPPDCIVLEEAKDTYGNPQPYPIFYRGPPGEARVLCLRWAVQYHLDNKSLSTAPNPSAPAPPFSQDALRDAVEKVVGVATPECLRRMVRAAVQQCNGPRRTEARQGTDKQRQGTEPRTGLVRTRRNHSPRVEPYGTDVHFC